MAALNIFSDTPLSHPRNFSVRGLHVAQDLLLAEYVSLRTYRLVTIYACRPTTLGVPRGVDKREKCAMGEAALSDIQITSDAGVALIIIS